MVVRSLLPAYGEARLFAEPDLKVLWLSRGRHELALSDSGLWLRRASRERELTWAEVDQVQAVVQRRDKPWMVLEVFAADDTAYGLGPFPRTPAVQWVEACAEAAQAAGYRLLPLEGAVGFSLTSPSGEDLA